VVAIRANQQIARAIVRAFHIDVMDMFASLQGSAKRLFCNSNMHRLGSCFPSRPCDSFEAVDIPADSNVFVSASFGDIAAAFTPCRGRQFHPLAIRAWIERLAMRISWQADPFRLFVRGDSAFLESRLYANFQQVRSLFIGHRTGILVHGDGIA
jgi:hypothetical protein